MLLNQFERNIALTGAGRVNDSCHTASIALLPPGRFSHYAQDSRNATYTHSCRNQGVSSIWIMEDTAYFCSCVNSCTILS